MKFISKISEISDYYSHFIFDIWGVIHDGSAAYPHAVETISALRKQGKKICFLSNAPRRSSKVATMLSQFGVTSDLYDFVISSGEATFLDLEKNQQNNFKTFGKNYLYIGPDKDLDLLKGLDYIRAEDAAKASFVINTGFEGVGSTLNEKLPQALAALKHNLPMICVNPDMIVVKQNGDEFLCAGALAKEYERLGGKVIYYGKPYLAVYKTVCEIFSNPENKKILAIGDSLETDIRGANAFGIDNLLTTGGILINTLGIKHGEVANKAKLETICNSYQTFPKFIIPNLSI